jgi:hypothetical protein
MERIILELQSTQESSNQINQINQSNQSRKHSIGVENFSKLARTHFNKNP